MKIIIHWLNKRWLIAFLLIACLFVDAILVGRAYNLSTSDWGTWVGSIGTVLTLIGTIWLATAGERRKREEAHDRALVATAALRLRIRKVERALQGAIDHFFDKKMLVMDYATQAKLIAQAGIWTDEQILPLIIVPEHVCARLSAIRTEIADVIVELEELAHIEDQMTFEQKEKRLAAMVKQLIRCRDVVSFCRDECRKFMEMIAGADNVESWDVP